jgi:RNA polymerase sigma factor (TIGR02999 family)
MLANHEVTDLLTRWGAGDDRALGALMPVVYAELHRLAIRAVHGERRDHTLQATGLVHEAFLRLARGAPAICHDRSHFFALAARLMRHILVDHARQWQAERRGAGVLRVSLEDAGPLAGGATADITELDAAVRELAVFDPRKAKVIELRFFGGLSVEETAAVLRVSVPTVILDTRLAKAYLYERLFRSAAS